MQDTFTHKRDHCSAVFSRLRPRTFFLAPSLFSYLLGVLQEPGLGGGSIGDGLLGGKGLGGNDEESGLGLDGLEDLSDVSAVNVADKVDLKTTLCGVGLQGLSDHDRAQIRSTDTNVDNVLDLVTLVTLPLARADRFGEFAHVLENSVNLGHDVLTLAVDGGVGNVAESDVQDGAVLGEVNGLAREHLGAHLLNASLLGQVDEVLEGLGGDQVLGVVEEDGGLCGGAGEVTRELLEAGRVLGEELLHNDLVGLGVVVGLESVPCLELVCENHAVCLEGG